MKKLALAVSILAASSVAASAADLAARPYTKAPPMVVAIYDWSGFYIGLDGGGGWARKCWDITRFGPVTAATPFGEGCSRPTGGQAGGQIGYRWQSASWVFGLEAKGDWANYKSSTPSLFFIPGTVTNESKVNALGLFTGSVGYAVNNVLFSLKGGAMVAADKYNGIGTITGVTFDTASETRVGGLVGAAVEYGFTPNISVAFEYDHGFMGTKSVDFTSTGVGTTVPAGTFSRTDRIRQDLDMVTARINYRFGGPVVARY